ncbi:hypothetical protein CGLO_14512 [Colletotrichum gloeosporioides Cg-14]|uniref:Uncharacterized protein n=1 Tax=Colletotrichum gloeosporioides (strain Cg-14) TaxID=1237896 RepID=T0K3V3_COLGC|nr:hypothetical protein CGLO_14512 [Colletotrichum gloeosporioides Cg-14]
MRLGTSLNI